MFGIMKLNYYIFTDTIDDKVNSIHGNDRKGTLKFLAVKNSLWQ